MKQGLIETWNLQQVRAVCAGPAAALQVRMEASGTSLRTEGKELV